MFYEVVSEKYTPQPSVVSVSLMCKLLINCLFWILSGTVEEDGSFWA